MKYACQTRFDITATGVTGHFKATRVPFKDLAGQVITDQTSWDRSRNQQRNWETIMQILGLRTQISNNTTPVRDRSGTKWMFEFETETTGAFGSDQDPTKVLRADANGVPMLRELDNDPDIEPMLIVEGKDQNIWFALVE